MHSELAGLMQDAASLHRFVRFLREFCEERRATHHYLSSSRAFFLYVQQLAEKTETFLQRLISSPEPTYRSPRAERKVAALKRFWTVLHWLIKPAADAHTLRVPVPLLGLLERHLRSLGGFSESKVVTLLSPDLNYFQYRTGPLRELAAQVTLMLDAPPFPEGLGFIAIPYSQESRLFTNLLLYHELGHFAFETEGNAAGLLPQVDDALTAVLGEQFASAPEPLRSWCRGRLVAWCEETYADLFATFLIGPAYSFASIELFNLLALLEAPRSLRFDSEHTADAYRFNEQLNYLKNAGWWQCLGGAKTEHQKLIEKLAARKEEEYLYPVPDIPQLGSLLIRAFLRVRVPVRELVAKTCKECAADTRPFVAYSEAIWRYLANATVPSTLSLGGEAFHPPEVATINSAFLFSLASLSRLLAKVEGYDASRPKVSDYGQVAGRIELWTMKAIEDLALLSRRPKVG